MLSQCIQFVPTKTVRRVEVNNCFPSEKDYIYIFLYTSHLNPHKLLQKGNPVQPNPERHIPVSIFTKDHTMLSVSRNLKLDVIHFQNTGY